MTSGCSAAWQRASFGTKRSWVQIPPPRQLSSRSEGSCRIGEGPLALLSVHRGDQRWRSARRCRPSPRRRSGARAGSASGRPGEGISACPAGHQWTSPYASSGSSWASCRVPRRLRTLGRHSSALDTTVRHVRFPRRRRPALPVRSVLAPWPTGVLPGPHAPVRVLDEAGEHDHFLQVHCELVYEPRPGLAALGDFNSWFFHDSGNDVDQWAETLTSREAWAVIREYGPVKVEVYQEPVRGSLMRPAGRRPAEHHTEYRGRSHPPRFGLSPRQQVSAYVVFQAGGRKGRRALKRLPAPVAGRPLLRLTVEARDELTVIAVRDEILDLVRDGRRRIRHSASPLPPVPTRSHRADGAGALVGVRTVSGLIRVAGRAP